MNQVAKIGDTIRIKYTGACGADVSEGDVLKVAESGCLASSDLIKTKCGWVLRPEDYDIVADPEEPQTDYE